MKHPAKPAWSWHRGFMLLGFSLALAVGLALGGCQAAETPAPETAEPPPPPTATAIPEPTATPLPDQSAQLAAWEAGVHGSTYDLGKGPNTYCSRCHSPQNWDPESTTDRPPNCVTCKFPTDEEIRMATTMDFVEEEDWAGIGCITCHEMENGVVTEGIAWLNPITMEHEVVNTPNELCGKCHADTQGVSATGGRGVTHQITLGGSAHLEWAGELPQVDRPNYCSDCHDPHSGEPTQCVDCHEDVLSMDTHIKGMNAVHTNVACTACHDASGMEVGPHPDEAEGGRWVTLVSSISRSGAPTTEYVKSHSVQWEVSCDRCHFEENPFDLTVLTAEGEIPEAEAED